MKKTIIIYLFLFSFYVDSFSQCSFQWQLGSLNLEPRLWVSADSTDIPPWECDDQTPLPNLAVRDLNPTSSFNWIQSQFGSGSVVLGCNVRGVHNALQWTQVAAAYHFSNSSNTTEDDFIHTESHTVVIILKIDSLDANQANVIFDNRDFNASVATTNRGITILHDTRNGLFDNNFRVKVGNQGEVVYEIDKDNTFPTQVWSLAIVTFDEDSTNNAVKLRVNGLEVATTNRLAVPSAGLPQRAAARIGERTGSSTTNWNLQSCSGELHTFAVYPGVLDQESIEKIECWFQAEFRIESIIRRRGLRRVQ